MGAVIFYFIFLKKLIFKKNVASSHTLRESVYTEREKYTLLFFAGCFYMCFFVFSCLTVLFLRPYMHTLLCIPPERRGCQEIHTHSRASFINKKSVHMIVYRYTKSNNNKISALLPLICYYYHKQQESPPHSRKSSEKI